MAPHSELEPLAGVVVVVGPLILAHTRERHDVKIAAYNRVGPGPVCEVSAFMWDT